MDYKNEDEGFRFTYSAEEQEELQKIRQKYMPKETDKMRQLQKLDQSVTQKATILSILMGVIGSLFLGLGMSCCMVWGGVWFIPGIIIGLAGMLPIGFAYPVYTRVLKREREKIAPEILRLIDELMR